MEAVLQLVRPNAHVVDTGTGQVLFHVPSSSLFALDGAGAALLRLLGENDGVPWSRVQSELAGTFDEAVLAEALEEFRSLDIVSDGGPVRLNREPAPVRRFPLTTVVLNVNTGCNLSCTYCYKEDLTTPSKGEKMAYDTAIEAVEMLLRESPDERRYNVVFFGGEPLSNMPLIRRVVDYCEPRFRGIGRGVDFTLTTNATLLTEELIDYFSAHRFGLTISMDGPKALHDRNRVTIGGRGTYALVRSKVDMLLARYRARPVGARVTLTRGITDVEQIFEHLHDEVGFHEVGFGPVTSGENTAFNLTDDEIVTVFEGMKRLGERYLDAALEHRHFGFGNMHQLMTDLHEGNRKALPCGAGVGLLAVDKDGGLNLCHRFTGSDLPLFGNTRDGIDRPRLANFLEQRLDRKGTGCESCRIRNICSGGCYHESYVKYGDAAHPTYHYCELLRDWVDFGLNAYARILSGNPKFFDVYVSPRRAVAQ